MKFPAYAESEIKFVPSYAMGHIHIEDIHSFRME